MNSSEPLHAKFMQIRSDYDLIQALLNEINNDSETAKEFPHPLDGDIINKLKGISRHLESAKRKHAIYEKVDEIKLIWKILIEKSVQCLRYFDTREPFSENPSVSGPAVFGLDDLEKYFNEYSDFESLLYGSNNNYRDHLIHVFSTWLLGCYILLLNEGDIIKSLQVEGIGDNIAQNVEIGNDEKLSMWTIIALCHDLGYPLEKAKEILKKTNKMMGFLISNPEISGDFNFRGTQDFINDYVVKLISSKMVEKGHITGNGDVKKEDKLYTGRIQPKYYIKYSKSLEKFSHGIVSTLIVYKALLYFIESDYNINEDYFFSEDDKNQYYIRREILRAIASHTCPDIYHLRFPTLSCLLVICDEMQEWERRKYSVMYSPSTAEERILEINKITTDDVDYTEEINISLSELKAFIQVSIDKFNYFKKIFREAQDSRERDFNLKRTIILRVKKDRQIGKVDQNFRVELCQSFRKNESSEFTYWANDKKHADYLKEILGKGTPLKLKRT